MVPKDKDPAKFGSKNIDLFKYHERDTYRLNYFIGQDRSITDLYREEAYAETIRLLYVAITRAEHRCYLCVTPFSKFHLSPLGQTLKLSAEDDLQHKLLTLAESEPESIHLQQIVNRWTTQVQGLRNRCHWLSGCSEVSNCCCLGCCVSVAGPLAALVLVA